LLAADVGAGRLSNLQSWAIHRGVDCPQQGRASVWRRFQGQADPMRPSRTMQRSRDAVASSRLGRLTVAGLTAGLVVLLGILGSSAASSAVPESHRHNRVASGITAGPTAAAGFRLPLAGRAEVVRVFAAPANQYAAGHRGVDLAAPQGGAVLAAAAGTVRFAGSVAGRGLVVLTHSNGISTEYEPLAVGVRTGERVQVGEPLGSLSGRHGRCSSGCLHWGAQRRGRYFDPMTLLEPLGVIRLIPSSR
jgi:murein DD-endopeptidase MepM/ murein hydrolase activator NlpD